ncbi:hypothetical protein D3C57_102570 [Streptomyces rapamycinicus NRRL 5491]|uniref:Uncharacterized protein n=2 Tax=Streptomyces rapamycinicus TaxID=1226757 RepID=A0A3L8RC97_STRRN|nr:hypothetical protein D3C57_102570 [Streptomyces rapamycinicus NRRL 5491]
MLAWVGHRAMANPPADIMPTVNVKAFLRP